MIVRFLAIAATLLLLSACSGSDETLADSAGAGGTAAGAGIGTTDTTGLGSPTELGTGGAGAAAGAMGPGTQHDLEVNVGDRVYFGYDSSVLDDQARATVERQAPDRWDLTGAAVCLVGAAIILLGPRTAAG